MAAYLEVIKRDPQRADALMRLAVLNDQRGRTEEAAEWYRKALKAEYMARHPMTYRKGDEVTQKKELVYSDEDGCKIKERVNPLRYLK